MATSFVICGFHTIPNNKLILCQSFDPLSPPKSTAAQRCFSPANRKYLSSGSRSSQHGKRSKMEFIVYSGDQVADLLPFGISLPDSWPVWITGLLVGIVGSFFTNKWGPLGKFKEELDKVEVMVDNVADRVVGVAEKVEDLVGDIADDLPEGSSFRQTLEKVEKVADKVGKDAQMVSDMVDKMDELEAKVESMIDTENQKKDSTTKTDVKIKVEPQSTNT